MLRGILVSDLFARNKGTRKRYGPKTKKMFNNKRVLLTIKVLGGESSKKIAISSDETVQVLFDKMCEKLNISEKKYFGICEQIYDDLNAPLGR